VERNPPKFTEIPALPTKRMIQTFSTDTPLLAPTPLAALGWGVGFRPLLHNAKIRYHALRKNLAALCRQYGMAEMARKKSHTSKASFFEAVNLTRNKPHPPNSPTRYGEAEESLPSARQSREAQVCAAQSGACVGALARGFRIRSGKIKCFNNIQLNIAFLISVRYVFLFRTILGMGDAIYRVSTRDSSN
jgi:hypothetical protein